MFETVIFIHDEFTILVFHIEYHPLILQSTAPCEYHDCIIAAPHIDLYVVISIAAPLYIISHHIDADEWYNFSIVILDHWFQKNEYEQYVPHSGSCVAVDHVTFHHPCTIGQFIFLTTFVAVLTEA